METLTEIRNAINAKQIDRARDLLRPLLANNPTAEVYYLAAQVAVTESQKRDMLQKALESDPFYAPAAQELEKLQGVPARPSPPRSGGNQTIVNRIIPMVQQVFKTVVNIIIAGTIIQRLVLVIVVVVVIGAVALPSVLTNGNSDATARAEALKIITTMLKDTQTYSYDTSITPSIVSIQKGYSSEDPERIEYWCVTFSPPVSRSRDPISISHFILWRNGLRWDTYHGGGQMQNETDQNTFLQFKCTNWAS